MESSGKEIPEGHVLCIATVIAVFIAAFLSRQTHSVAPLSGLHDSGKSGRVPESLQLFQARKPKRTAAPDTCTKVGSIFKLRELTVMILTRRIV
ncbi:hypothetical protein NDN08_007348 [Rhodosorus marinus]|uniref:Uncharacterized protein n=1 Tax=Rhodosorus marinus TaxID=101924 RepID=A0AAV8UG97_9RHOD|nr:hypothetical protein NDN08_007348 [Rhodosorus marinus]